MINEPLILASSSQISIPSWITQTTSGGYIGFGILFWLLIAGPIIFGAFRLLKMISWGKKNKQSKAGNDGEDGTILSNFIMIAIGLGIFLLLNIGFSFVSDGVTFLYHCLSFGSGATN